MSEKAQVALVVTIVALVIVLLGIAFGIQDKNCRERGGTPFRSQYDFVCLASGVTR